MTKQLENYYRLAGLMRDKPEPEGFKKGEQWTIEPFVKDKKQ
jgi:hypothetical protein